MLEKMYEIRYGTASNEIGGAAYARIKSVKINDWGRAEAFYKKVLKFAEDRGLVWTVALWDGGWLIRSDTTNAEVFVGR